MLLRSFSTCLLIHVPELCQQKVQHSLILFTPTHALQYTHTYIHITHIHTLANRGHNRMQTANKKAKLQICQNYPAKRIYPSLPPPPSPVEKFFPKISPTGSANHLHGNFSSSSYPLPSPLLSIFRIDFPPKTKQKKTSATRKRWGIRLTFRLEFGLEGIPVPIGKSQLSSL